MKRLYTFMIQRLEVSIKATPTVSTMMAIHISPKMPFSASPKVMGTPNTTSEMMFCLPEPI